MYKYSTAYTDEYGRDPIRKCYLNPMSSRKGQLTSIIMVQLGQKEEPQSHCKITNCKFDTKAYRPTELGSAGVLEQQITGRLLHPPSQLFSCTFKA